MKNEDVYLSRKIECKLTQNQIHNVVSCLINFEFEP